MNESDLSANLKKLQEVSDTVDRFKSVLAKFETVCTKSGFKSYPDFLAQLANLKDIAEPKQDVTKAPKATDVVSTKAKRNKKKKSHFIVTEELCATLKARKAEGAKDEDLIKNFEIPEKTYWRYAKKDFQHSGKKLGRPVGSGAGKGKGKGKGSDKPPVPADSADAKAGPASDGAPEGSSTTPPEHKST